LDRISVARVGLHHQTSGAVVAGIGNARIDEKLVPQDAEHSSAVLPLQVLPQLTDEPTRSRLLPENICIIHTEKNFHL